MKVCLSARFPKMCIFAPKTYMKPTKVDFDATFCTTWTTYNSGNYVIYSVLARRFAPCSNNKYLPRSWSGYNDELTWSAAWLYRASEDSAYLQKAETFYSTSGAGSQTEVLSWDNKFTGAQALLAKITGQSGYIQDVSNSCKAFMNKPRSPKGQTFFYQWGSLRYANNAAFICWQVKVWNMCCYFHYRHSNLGF